MQKIKGLFLAVLFAAPIAQAPAQVPLEQPDLDLWAHGAVFTSELNDDGQLLVGGLFSLAGGLQRSNIARILPDEDEIDPGFAPIVNGPVFSILPLQDGSIVIGGQFNQVNGVARNNLARLNTDGTLDPNFDPGASAAVYAVRADGDGHVIVGGLFTHLGGEDRPAVARVALATGAVDEWNPPVVPGNAVFDLLVVDEAIWVGGALFPAEGPASGFLASLNIDDGALRTEYETDGNVEVLSFDPANGLYFCGRFSVVGEEPRSRLARLDIDGDLDDFSIDVDQDVTYCRADADGSLLVGGAFVSINGEPVQGAARLSPDAQLDLAFQPFIGGQFSGNPGSDVLVWTLRELDEDRIFVGGVFRNVDNETRIGAALIDRENGVVLEPSFHMERRGEVRAVQQLPDLGLIVGGNFWRSGDAQRNNLLRLGRDGELDSDWTATVNGDVLSLAVTSDEQLFVGGFFNAADNQPRRNLAGFSLEPDAALDPAWSTGTDNAVLVLQQDVTDPNQLLVGGAFENIIVADQVEPRSRAARLSLETGLPDSFNPALDDQVNDLLQMPSEGRVFLAGLFTQAGGQERIGLAAFAADDEGELELDAGFNAQANSFFWVLIDAEDEGDFFAGGQFTRIFGQQRQRLARLGTAGLSTWTASARGTPVALALDGLDGLYVGGNIDRLNNTVRNLLGRVSVADGSLDTQFNPSASPGVVWGLTIGPERLFVHGSFLQIGGVERVGLATFEVETLEQLPPPPPRPDPLFSDRFESIESEDESEARAVPGESPDAQELGVCETGNINVMLGRNQTDFFVRAPGC